MKGKIVPISKCISDMRTDVQVNNIFFSNFGNFDYKRISARKL